MRNSHPVILVNTPLLFSQWLGIGANNEVDESSRHPRTKLYGPFQYYTAK